VNHFGEIDARFDFGKALNTKNLHVCH